MVLFQVKWSFLGIILSALFSFRVNFRKCLYFAFLKSLYLAFVKYQRTYSAELGSLPAVYRNY